MGFTYIDLLHPARMLSNTKYDPMDFLYLIKLQVTVGLHAVPTIGGMDVVAYVVRSFRLLKFTKHFNH